MPFRLALLAAVSVVVCLSAIAAQAQEWTRFRGANGQGQSESAAGIPVQFTEKDYNWKVKLPGAAHSSPVLWGDKIFLTSADPQAGTRYAVCLNAADGKENWKREFPSSSHHVHTQNSFASSSPAVDAERVYIAFATPEDYRLLALDHAGKDVWNIGLGTYTSQHGFGTSPIVVDDTVIITNDQDEAKNCFLLAVDAKTGKERWKLSRRHTGERQNASYATPCIRETAAGKEIIVCSWAHGVSSHNPKTGEVNWETTVFPRRPVGSPVLAGDLILGNCGEGSGNNTVVAIKPSGKKGDKPAVVYTLDKTSAPYVTTLCTAGNLAFLWGDKGIVTCIDVNNGKVHWRERVGGNYSGSPVRVGDRIYCISAEGDVVVLAASPEFKELGRSSLGETCRSTPAVADGKMYLRTQSHLVSIGGKN